MNKKMLALLIFTGSVWAVTVHGQEPCVGRSKILLSPDKPSVYLSYERMATQPKNPVRLAEGGQYPSATGSTNVEGSVDLILLRLRNNTSWAIGFPTESMYIGLAVTAWSFCDGTGVLGLRDGIEVNGRYELEMLQDAKTSTNSPSTKQPEFARIDVFSTSWLPPGRSVIIPVMKKHLKKDIAIYLPFNYEWETVKGVTRGGEAQHRVYFYSWNLPANADR